MKSLILKSAVAVALGTVGSSAFAFTTASDPNSYPLALAGYYEVNFSGATASSNTARTWIIDRVCDAAQPIDVYRRWSGAYGNDWAVACVTKTHQDVDGDGINDGASETVGAKQVLFRKRDNGGSGWGVTPVTHPMNVALGTAALSTDPVNAGGTATGFQVSVMSVTTGAGAGFNCDTTANPPVAGATAALTNYTEYKCGAGVVNRVPDAGLSDIEPNKFFGINKASDLPEYIASSAVTSNTFGALVFGTPVTLDLRNALQLAQFDKITSNCNPLNPNYALDSDVVTAGVQPWSETEGCMPSLTSMEIRSLFTGGIKKWTSFMVTNPAAPAGAKISLLTHPDVVAMGIAPLTANNQVQVCRRVQGSGTQAQSNAIFLNWPCDTNVSKPTTAAQSSTGFGPVVAENSGSSDVSKCLDDFNDASNVSTKNAGLIKRWAIGINSTENNMNLAFNYRFVKIDGAAPTIQAVFNGDYHDYAEQSFQFRNNTATLLNANVAADKTDTLVVLNHISAQGNTPNDTATANLAYVHTFGQGGWLVTPKTTGGFSPSNPFVLTNPVNSNTRAPFGNAPNTCHFPTVIKTVLTGG